MKNWLKNKQVLGWLAVAISTAITGFWAYWGILENFHEGWYFETLPANLGLMVAQYLSPMLAFMAVTVIAIRWPRLGAGLHVLLAVLAAWFFEAFTDTVVLLLLFPLVGLGVLYWFARPQPRTAAIAVAVGLPIFVLIAAGVLPAVRASQRVDDGLLGPRLVEGNGVKLIWAPDGPGWPLAGTDWQEARLACQHLSADGLALSPDLQGIWRLPTVEEAVRSMARHGENSGGEWHAGTAETTYQLTPDKESPLWNVYSQVIYWWTATEVDERQAYIIVYDGRVWPRSKQFGPAYLGFRCVREP